MEETNTVEENEVAAPSSQEEGNDVAVADDKKEETTGTETEGAGNTSETKETAAEANEVSAAPEEGIPPASVAEDSSAAVAVDGAGAAEDEMEPESKRARTEE